MRRFPSRLTRRLASCVFAVALAASPAWSQQPAPQTLTELRVERLDLVVEAAVEGTLQPVRSRKIWNLPEAFGGPAVVLGLVPSGSRVQAGEQVVELESRDLDRDIRRAHLEVEAAEAELGFLEADHAVREDDERQRIQQREESVARAVREQESFEKLTGPRMLEGAALGVKRAQHGVDDRKEELAQLEGMYRQSELASETQEIVLQRARRDVASSEAGLQLTRADEAATRLYGHPDRGRELALAVDYRVLELARERESIRIARGRRGLEMSRARQRVKDAHEQADRLKRDRERLKLTAPAAGVVTHSLEEGDLVHPRTVVFTLQDVDRLKLAAEADAALLRVLAEGASARVVPEDFPDLSIAGTLLRIAPIGRAAEGKGKPARFPVEVALPESHALLRPGQRCTATIAGLSLKGVTGAPRRAFVTADGKTTCRVRAGGETVTRTVVLGLGDVERVHVVQGLEPGDVLVIDEGGAQ